jgi:tRNA(fMet)-specific endonuclease VapC
MRYLLDADWCIDYLANIRAARRLYPTLIRDGVVVSVVTEIELLTVAYGGPDPATAIRQLRGFLRAVTRLLLNQRVVQRTARLRARLRSRNAPIKHRAYDLIVAATALEYDLTLVSSNVRDYQDIPGLTLLNPRTGQTRQNPI